MQRQLAVVGDAEGDVENALLHVVQLQEAGEQQRPHLLDRSADRMPLFAEQIPKDHREGPVAIVREADLCGALLQERLRDAGRGKAGKVALHIGGEHRHALLRQALGDDLQRDRLARSGRAGDEPVPVCQAQEQLLLLLAGAEEYRVFRVVAHLICPP